MDAVTRVFYSSQPEIQAAVARGVVFACGRGLIFLRMEQVPGIGVCGVVQHVAGTWQEERALTLHAIEWARVEGLEKLLVTFWSTDALKVFRDTTQLMIDPIGAVCAISLPKEVQSNVQPVDVRRSSIVTEQAAAGEGVDEGMAWQAHVANGPGELSAGGGGARHHRAGAKRTSRKKAGGVGRSVSVFPDSGEASAAGEPRAQGDPLRF